MHFYYLFCIFITILWFGCDNQREEGEDRLQHWDLKATQEQIANGSYTILLQPDLEAGAPWFTKGTVVRFVQHTGGSGARDGHHVQDTAARGHHSRPEQWYLGLKSAEGHDRKPVNSVEVHPLLLWCWCEISFCKVTRQSIPTNLQALFLSSLPLNPRQYFIESVNFLLNW